MSIFNNIKMLFGNKKTNKVLGVDIGSSSIKVVQLSLKKGVAVLDTFGEISLSIYGGKEIGKTVNLSDDKIAEALKDLIKEAQVDTKIAAFAIPLKSTLMFNLKLPKTIEKNKLDKIVKMEARKYIPVPISEVQMDWSILPALNEKERNSENNDILVVAIHKETLNQYANIASVVGLELNFLEVETFSTIRAVVKYERNTTAIVDIGSSVTKFYIVEHGIIRKSHIINIGSAKMLSRFRGEENTSSLNGEVNSQAAKMLRETIGTTTDIPVDLERIINEVKKAIISFQKINRRDITDVVFTGGGSLFKDILPFVAQKLSANVSNADPFSKVSNPAFLDAALKEAGPEFSVAVGVALRGLK